MPDNIVVDASIIAFVVFLLGFWVGTWIGQRNAYREWLAGEATMEKHRQVFRDRPQRRKAL